MGLSMLVHGIALSAYYAYRHQPESAKLEFHPDRVMELVVLSEPVEMPAPAAAKTLPQVVPEPVAVRPLPEMKPVVVPQSEIASVSETAMAAAEPVPPPIQEIPQLPTPSAPVNSAVSPKAEVSAESAEAGSPANYLFNPRPLYPLTSRQRKEEGLVVLSVRVSKEGLPGGIQVVQSSGHALLDQAAVRAVSQWRFTPARLGQQPVASQIEIPVRFKLSISK